MRDRPQCVSLLQKGKTIAESQPVQERAVAKRRERLHGKNGAPEMAIRDYKENVPIQSDSKVTKSLSAPAKVGNDVVRWPGRVDGLGSRDISNCLHDFHSPERQKKSRLWSSAAEEIKNMCRSPFRQKGPQSSPTNAMREEAVEAPSQPSSSPSRSSCSQTEVIVLHGSPIDHPPIDCRTELQMLDEALNTTGIQIKIGLANTDSLTHVLSRAQSCESLMLYVSAHGMGASSNNIGLGLEKLDGMVHILWPAQLDELLSAHEADLENVFLVFLNACSSEEIAQVFIEHGCRHVIAVRGSVLNTAAMKFARVFFTSLASGASIMKAFTVAKTNLSVDPDAAVQNTAERYVLFGQNRADKETLCDPISTRECLSCPTLEDLGLLRCRFNFDSSCYLEDAKTCLKADLPSPHPFFFGRSYYIRLILECFRGNRACVVYGEQGVGKRTLGQEFARYASAPGRFFSCCAAIVEPEGHSVETLAGAVERVLLGLVQRHLGEAPELRVEKADRQATMSERAEEHIRIIQRLENVRRGAILIVIHDRTGVVSCSDVARNFLGHVIGRTQRAYFLVCSPEPVHGLLGSRKANNVQVFSLSRLESARLFLKYVHRNLTAADFGGRALPDSLAELTSLLSEHVLLQQLGGNPRKICDVAARLVVPMGPTLLDIAASSCSNDFGA